jgi:hypothetical protein
VKTIGIMSQQQHVIPLKLLDGTEVNCIRTGNNAAWICPCKRELPLLGHSAKSLTDRTVSVICPDCQREFLIFAPTSMSIPTHVEELPKS